MHDQIDILMATYNGEKYLKEQLLSILTQSYQNVRIFISDDFSTDNTRNIIDQFVIEYPEKVFFIPSDKKLGARGNFSYLMQYAKSDYVMFSDQDDIWNQEKILTTYLEMKRLEEIHGKTSPLLVHSDLVVVDQNLNVLGNSFWKYTNLKVDTFKTMNRFLVQNVVTGCTIMMNKRLNDLCFPLAEEAIMHDWWIALVASTFGQIGFVKEPLILYRQHGNNTVGAKKFGTLSYFIGIVRKLIKTQYTNDFMSPSQVQARSFLKRYQDKLNLEQQQVIESYIYFNRYSWIKKRIEVLKNSFYKSGFLRNFVPFLVRLRF